MTDDQVEQIVAALHKLSNDIAWATFILGIIGGGVLGAIMAHK